MQTSRGFVTSWYFWNEQIILWKPKLKYVNILIYNHQFIEFKFKLLLIFNRGISRGDFLSLSNIPRQNIRIQTCFNSNVLMDLVKG